MGAATKSRTYKSGKRVLKERPVREPKLLPYKKLPDKPSALIRLALRDLEKTERSRSYKVAMHTWHESNGHCTVCFAGAVMAQTLNIPKNMDMDPSTLCGGIWYGDCGVMQFKNKSQRVDLERKLLALNNLRQGDVESAYATLHRRYPAAIRKMVESRDVADYGVYPVTPYSADKKQFKIDMRRLARDLAKLGA